MLKIIYISDSIIPSRTANSIHVMKMCHAFANNNNEVLLIAPERESDYEPNVNDVYNYYGVKNNFKIKKLKYYNIKGKSLLESLETQRLISKYKPDLVYGRHTVGCCISALFGYKTIFEAHSLIWNSSFRNKLAFKLMTKSQNFINLVLISKAMKQLYSQKMSNLEKKSLVFHDGADVQKDFSPCLPAGNNLRVGYCGHLYPGRGIELLIELAKKLPEIEFHIIGGTKDDNLFWKSKVNFKNLIFHGFVEPRMVYKYRNSFDILVAPYQNKVSVSGAKGSTGNTVEFMSPLKIFEYMSSKKAIISSNKKVLKEVLNDNNAILVECDNIDQWAKALEKLSDPVIRSQYASNAYHTFVTKYSWKQRAKDILASIRIS